MTKTNGMTGMNTEPDDQADPRLSTREERAAVVASVRHSTELEGGRSTDFARELQEQWVEGRIDLDELGRRLCRRTW
ncbi:antitoxin VbhA family protein [Kribbella sp. NBC_01484]|uniref:antitoxin VbhA family protein n=1 Tax=Kribbella sp. NBC_01484 TaxID=2903579 RepID=UPI002E37EFF4|nr:antitoxin VbhA family protein [Kribbella sp. NBC_01484]